MGDDSSIWVVRRSLAQRNPEELAAPHGSAHHPADKELREVTCSVVVPTQRSLLEDLDPGDGRIRYRGLEPRANDLNLGKLGRVAW